MACNVCVYVWHTRRYENTNILYKTSVELVDNILYNSMSLTMTKFKFIIVYIPILNANYNDNAEG